MPKIVTTESFKNKAVNTHGHSYLYNKVNYINNKTKVTITCPSHGDFQQTPSDHLSAKGCPDCGGKKYRTKKSFIEKANKVHNSIYNYSLTDFSTTKDKISIICSEHGKFKQRGSNHLNGQGCPKCSVEQKEPTGWRLNDWKKAAEKSKNFDSFKVYIIRCWNEEEEFFKIGRTFVTVKLRFSANFYMPYNWEIMKEIKGDSESIFDLEKELHRKNKHLKYLPKIKFKGLQECYKTIQHVS